MTRPRATINYRQKGGSSPLSAWRVNWKGSNITDLVARVGKVAWKQVGFRVLFRELSSSICCFSSSRRSAKVSSEASDRFLEPLGRPLREAIQ